MATNPKIAIIGLGLIGTSLGLALKHAGGNFEIIGHDKEAAASTNARKREAVDKTSWNLIAAVDDASVVILAIPISEMEKTLRAISHDLQEGAVIIDTCAVKRPVLAWAETILPDGISFIGGDPILRASLPADAGPENASAELLQNALFCLCPTSRTPPETIQLAAEMVSAIGAHPYFLDAAEHDGLVAGVEHLPLAAAGAFLHATTHSPGWKELRKVAGDAFLDATRLRPSDPEAAAETLRSNADNVVRWIDALMLSLHELKTSLQEEDAAQLAEFFSQGSALREEWLRDRAQGFAAEEMPRTAETPGYWRSLLVGDGSLFRRSRGGEGDER